MSTNPASPHILVDLTCPRCKRKNSVAIKLGVSDVERVEIKCAYCKQSWEQELPVHLWLDRFRSDLHSVYPYVISCQQFHLRIRASYLIWKTQRHRQCHIAFQSTMAVNPNGLLRKSTPGWSSIKKL